MFELTLNSGRVVYVSGIHASDTYAGMLLGTPDVEQNTTILRDAATRMERMWGQLPTYVVHPVGESGASVPERLPLVEWAAWLESDPVRSDDADGSHLVVVWFRDANAALPLRDIITAGVRAVPWETLAEDFWF